MPNAHTPGPWTLGDESNPLVFSPAAGAYVAQVLAYTDGDTGTLRAGVDADARLIASAPDLLVALESLARAVERFTNATPEDWPELAAARAAINKVTGA